MTTALPRYTADGLRVRHNPYTPPRDLRRTWRAPYQFDVCRIVLAYRLLGFGVDLVAAITGVSIKNVKRILTIFGMKMPRRGRFGTGSVIWNRSYEIKAESHRVLCLPSYIPLRVEHANGRPEFLEGVDVMMLKLPEPTKRPEKDGFSNWLFR